MTLFIHWWKRQSSVKVGQIRGKGKLVEKFELNHKTRPLWVWLELKVTLQSEWTLLTDTAKERNSCQQTVLEIAAEIRVFFIVICLTVSLEILWHIQNRGFCYEHDNWDQKSLFRPPSETTSISSGSFHPHPLPLRERGKVRHELLQEKVDQVL